MAAQVFLHLDEIDEISAQNLPRSAAKAHLSASSHLFPMAGKYNFFRSNELNSTIPIQETASAFRPPSPKTHSAP
jgi:hypothetical protein